MKLFPANCFLLISVVITGSAQTVTVGKGSYGTALPSGAVGPQTSAGVNAVPKVSAAFRKPVQTNDFWSSLIYPFYGDPFSNVLYAHPIMFKAVKNGIAAGYTPTAVMAAQDYLYPFSQQLTIGVAGLNAARTVVDDYGDWTVTALWDDGTRTMKAVLGHGLPFVFVTLSGGSASIMCNSTPVIWSSSNGVLGLTVDGRHYGVFAPDSSAWTGTTTLQSTLNGKNFFSVALLPDNNPATLEFYRQHAYAFVAGSTVAWHYDETSARMTSTFSYTTELKESVHGQSGHTLTALYRHQWLHSTNPLTAYSYSSTCGPMRVFDGNQFTTDVTFEGVLPSLPDQGDYNPTELRAMIAAAASETLPAGPTYENGKSIARFAQLVNIADQAGAVAERDHFLSEIKRRLEGWFTAGGAESYVYNTTWATLTGYPSGYGADNQINDHNFHAGYAIMGAAIVAQFDSVWAAPENWGGMVDLLIRDGNCWDRNDARFPFLRSMDPYAGHSWESGHGDFGDGNNEESSSESMNFAAALTLWGAATHQKDVRDLGIYLYTTERTAIEQYWFDVDGAVFPAAYPYQALGMVWGGKGVHSTWFGANPEFIHGINMLPLTGGSLYLGRLPAYVKANFDEIVSELNGPPTIWQDIIWQYLALSDPGTALSLYYANPSYTPFDGESRAHTYHWLCNLEKMGHVDASVTADIPTYSVFKNAAGEKTYTAYNPAPDSVSVHFSDGYVIKVPPGLMRSASMSAVNSNAPVALLIADKTRGKAPLTVNLTGSKSFDRHGSLLASSWNFGDGKTAHAADTVHVFTDPGTYRVVVTVTNQLLLSARDSVLITVLGNGTPYAGTPIAIPGIVQAEFYDVGGEGLAYHDNDAANKGVPFRSSEGVDIEASNDVGGGYDISWIVSGEWVEYTIQVAADGIYTVTPVVASVPGGGSLHIEFNGLDLTGKKSVPVTGGWQFWQGMPISNIPLKAGRQIMHVAFGSGDFSLNWIEIKASTGTDVPESRTTPTQFGLDQNYPNPFNPTTTLSFSLPTKSFVILKIFDVLGREVAVLVSEELPAGSYARRWDASALSSGVYFCRIQAGNHVEAKRLLLLR